MTTATTLKIARITAIVSFGIGICIFLANLLTGALNALLAGYLFLLIAIPINLYLLLRVLNCLPKDKPNSKTIWQTAGLVIANMLILMLLCWVAVWLHQK